MQKSKMKYEVRGKIVAHLFAYAVFEMLNRSIAEDRSLAQRADAFGMLAAVQGEEYAAAHPAEISRRRFFFRRLLEECRWRGVMAIETVL